MPSYEIQRLLPRHFKIIELALDGHGTREIAELMGMSPVGVGIILNSAVVQDELSRRREGLNRKQDSARVDRVSLARQTLEHASLEAAEVLASHLQSEVPEVSKSAANSILEKVFSKSGEAKNSITILNVEMMQVLTKALDESKALTAA